MDKLISVIIPVYNAEKFLKCCLDSVVNQTYKNLEIILVDDGSKDNSLEICKKYAKKDKRINLICKENGGAATARNMALKIAKGDYITFVDSDDFINLQMYEYLYNLLVKYDSDIAICGHNIVLNDEIVDVVHCNFNGEKVLTGDEALIKIIEDEEINSFSCDKLFKKEVLVNYEYPMLSYHEDVAVLFKPFLKATKVVMGSKPMYNYRRNPNSVSNTLTPMKTYHSFKAYLEVHNTILKEKDKLKNLTIIRLAHAAIASINVFIRHNLYIKNKDAISDIRTVIKSNLKIILQNKKIAKTCKLYCLLSQISMPCYRLICKLNINNK